MSKKEKQYKIHKPYLMKKNIKLFISFSIWDTIYFAEIENFLLKVL